MVGSGKLFGLALSRLRHRLRVRLTDSYLLLVPPQSRLVDGRKLEVRHELTQLVNSQGLHEDVSRLQVRADVLQVESPARTRSRMKW